MSQGRDSGKAASDAGPIRFELGDLGFSHLGDVVLISDKEILFPKYNLVLRDIDGCLIVVSDHKEIEIGMYFDSDSSI